MNNKKSIDDQSTDVDIKIEKKNKGFWKKVTGIWDQQEKVEAPPAKIPNLPQDKTSRTLSSNHTFQGKIKSHELPEKGHNFDTTEVEMGKLGLHSVSSNGSDNKNKVHYSNVDNATLTGLKVDMKKPSMWDEITRTKLNIFSALKKMKNREEEITEDKINASTNTKVYNPEGTVLMAMPKTSNWSHTVKILVSLVVLGGILIGIFYAISYWSLKKDQTSNDPKNQNTISNEEVSTDKSQSLTKKDITQAVNYQVAGRGLIYNCVGKHWACVDKTNYIRCRTNFKSGSHDCVTKGVLKTTEACFEIQRKYTRTNVKTDFCSK